MTCAETRDRFSDAVDERMSPAERRDLDLHLAGCADCSRDFERFTATVSLLQSLESVRAPAGFVNRVVSATARAPWYRRVVERLFLPLPVKLPLEAATIVLVAVGVIYVFQATPELKRAARVETAPSAPAPVSPERPTSSSVGEHREVTDNRESGAKRKVDARRDTGAIEEKKTPAPPLSAPAPAAEPPATDGTSAATGAPAARDALNAPATSDTAKAPAVKGAERSAMSALKGAPAPEPSVAPGEQRKESSAQKAQGALRPSARMARSADVAGLLEVADPGEARQTLVSLATRHGGSEIARRDEADVAIVEVLVPRSAYAEFTRELASLGRWSVEREPADVPEHIRVSIRLTRRS